MATRPLTLTVVLLGLASAAGAQDQPNVPRDLMRNQQRDEDGRLIFCINSAALLADFDRALARELAQSLFYESVFEEVEPAHLGEAIQYRTLDRRRER